MSRPSWRPARSVTRRWTAALFVAAAIFAPHGRAASDWPQWRFITEGPVRFAPVYREGNVYFCSDDGYLYCVSAIDAETGQLLWQSDSMSYVQDGMSDHGKAYDLSLPPQGYLAVIDGRLAVPSGRSLAAWFDTATGAMEPYNS